MHLFSSLRPVSFTPDLTPDTPLELASNNDRVFAFIIDYMLVNIFVIPVWFISRDTTWFFILGIPIGIVALLIYKIVFETFTGTTIGKKQMKIFVINYEHQLPSFGLVFKRHLFYILIAFAGASYYAAFKIPAFNNMMRETFSPIALKLIGGFLSTYVFRIFAFIDGVSIYFDPQDQNRALHDRFAKTMVVRIKGD